MNIFANEIFKTYFTSMERDFGNRISKKKFDTDTGCRLEIKLAKLNLTYGTVQ